MTLFAGQRAFWLGYGTVILDFSVSIWLPLKGPVKPWNTVTERIDEHDELMRKNAYLAALPAILAWGFLALMLLPLWSELREWPQERRVTASMSCGFFLAILWNTVPTLYASWKWREDGED